MIYGISYDDFWKLTHKEIISISKCYYEKQKQEHVTLTRLAYTHSGMVAAASVGKLKNYDYYFLDDQEAKESDGDLELKRQLLIHAQIQHNKK